MPRFSGTEDPKTHLKFFQAQMLISGGLRRGQMQDVAGDFYRDGFKMVQRNPRWNNKLILGVLPTIQATIRDQYRETTTDGQPFLT